MGLLSNGWTAKIHHPFEDGTFGRIMTPEEGEALCAKIEQQVAEYDKEAAVIREILLDKIKDDAADIEFLHLIYDEAQKQDKDC